MNNGSVSRAAAACDLGGIRQSWPNRYAITVMAALIPALLLTATVSLSGPAAAETRNATTAADTSLREYSSTTNYGGATLGADGDEPGGSGKDSYALLRWDLSSMPAGASVDSASVTLNVTNPSTQTYQVYDLKRPWVESAATWQLYASGSPWEVAGAKGSLDRGVQVGSVSSSTTGKRTFNLSTTVVQRWLADPASHRGIVIANASNTDGIDFSSREAADASLRPSLSVNYTTTPPPTGTCNKGQFLAQYRNELKTFNTQPVLTRCETAINNDWGAGSPGSGVNADSFTSRWVGTFDFEASGYEFTATADDGVRLWVDGQLLIDQWKDQAASTYKATKSMTAGEHEVIVEYYENLGAAVTRVSWAKVAPPPPSGTDPPNACAHWHHSAQRAVSGANTVDAYRLEIRKAKAMGVDCFAYNVISVNLELPEIDRLYEAANLEGGFKLFPSADQCCGMSEADLDRLMQYRYNDPARMRVDGGRYGNNLPVAQTWHGEAKGPAQWTRIQNEWRAAGTPMFFIPYFDENAYGGSPASLVDVYNGANNADPSDDVVDGLFNFGGFASGDNALRASQKNTSYDTAVDASPGMDFMAGCSPHFNRHSDNGQFGNRILGDFEGFHSYITCLKGLVAERPRFIEFVTWNDYLEGSYLGGPYANSALWPTYRGNDLSHDAFRKIGAHYIEDYEGGGATVEKDLIAIAHRLHPENASGVNLNGAGILDDTDAALNDSRQVRPLVRQTDYLVVEDRLYAAVMLTQPGQVRLTSGTSTQTFDVPAGVTEVSMPFAAGTQKMELLRGGSVVLTATSARQVVSGPVSLFNYNVETTHAEGT